MVVWDTETSGVDVYNDRIVSCFIGVMLPDGTWEEKFEYLINPGVEIPQGAIDVHGITNERVKREGVDAKDGIFQILQRLDIYDKRGEVLSAFNASFDFTILKYEALRYGFRPFIPRFVIDGYITDKALDPYRKGKRKLVDMCETYGIPVEENAHDAAADCLMCGRLAYYLIDYKLKDFDRSTLMEKQKEWAKEQAASLQTYFRKTDPSVTIDGNWPIKAENKEENHESV